MQGEGALAMSRLVAALLPGDGHFPSAAEVGVQWAVPERLTRMLGPDGAAAFIAAASRAIAADDDAEAAARTLEAEQPAAFAALLRAVYLAYYEHPAVTAAIRALGHDYNDSPQPRGYAMDPFDPATDLPRAGSGHYVPTDAVRRLDLSTLDHLG